HRPHRKVLKTVPRHAGCGRFAAITERVFYQLRWTELPLAAGSSSRNPQPVDGPVERIGNTLSTGLWTTAGRCRQGAAVACPQRWGNTVPNRGRPGLERLGRGLGLERCGGRTRPCP